MAPSVAILMADAGNDPTEVAVPFDIFKKAGFDVKIVTEKGLVPDCDPRMLTGWTAKLLGADKTAIQKHDAMRTDVAFQAPASWTSPTFKLADYDAVFLPGGHAKGMQQIITSPTLHAHLAAYVPLTRRDGGQGKVLGAVCHGVQVLAAASDASGQSVIHEFETTSLTSVLENVAYWGTRLVLGDYYKTFGAGTDNVEVAVGSAEISLTQVRKRLDRPEQYKASVSPSPFVHEDPKHWYASGRWPGDAVVLSDKVVALVKAAKGGA